MEYPIPSHPILTLDEVRVMESALFEGDESAQWEAMDAAGRSVAASILRDFGEVGGLQADGRILVLAGKGNNAGDALIAARAILEVRAGATADVVFVFGSRALREPAARAWRELVRNFPERVRSVGAGNLERAYDLCIGGIFGFQFRPPLPPEALIAIAAADRCRVRLRAAVDLPSGLGEPGAFRADFTYATGSVKAPSVGCANSGRLRYLDLGFFGEETGRLFDADGGDRVILPSILSELAGLRPASGDKRSYGHLAILGGSAGFPGAALMTTLAALRSGVGLVTAFVPARLTGPFASQAPEAMWTGLPETDGGNLSLAGRDRVLKGLERATALLVGPGLGRDPETHSLVLEVVAAARVPVVIDADALQPDIVRTGASARILTPHAGEFERISDGLDLKALCESLPAVIVAQGALTRICGGGVVEIALAW